MDLASLVNHIAKRPATAVSAVFATAMAIPLFRELRLTSAISLSMITIANSVMFGSIVDSGSGWRKILPVILLTNYCSTSTKRTNFVDSHRDFLEGLMRTNIMSFILLNIF